MTFSDHEHCKSISLSGSKLAQAQPCSKVLSNVMPTVDHVAQFVLCRIKATS
jgi:hypothetical protein